MKAMRMVFDQVKTFKPKSSRQESKEIFFVGLEFKGGSPWQDMMPPV
jgi:23S rRNA (uridine2552-2'-O)-methyltransferase